MELLKCPSVQTDMHYVHGQKNVDCRAARHQRPASLPPDIAARHQHLTPAPHLYTLASLPPDTCSRPGPARPPEQRLVGVLALMRLQLLVLPEGPRAALEAALLGKGRSVSLEKNQRSFSRQTQNAGRL